MIAPSLIDSIRDLLAEGRLSQRRIAQRLGVSRGTVAGVAGGRRPDYEALRRQRDESKQPIAPGPLGRCPTCGGMVHRPCRLCALRSELAARPPRAPDQRPTEPLGLELRGDARARYEAIHLRRMQQGELAETDERNALDAEADNDDEAADDRAEWIEKKGTFYFSGTKRLDRPTDLTPEKLNVPFFPENEEAWP